jgi:hypothetical protein
MTRFTSSRWIAAAVTAAGLFAAVAAAQPPRPAGADPLDVAKARQKIADQKVESDVANALLDADRLAKSNPAKAGQLVKTARANLAVAVGVSDATRDRLSLLLDAKLALIEGRPLPKVGVPKPADAKAANKAAYDNYLAELKGVREGIERVDYYRLRGDNARANAEIAGLNKLYPNNPAVITLTQQDTIATRVADAKAFAKLMDDRVWASQKELMRSSLPAAGDIELPKDWKEKSERRLKGVTLTAREKKIIEALDKPVTVNFNNRPLEEALQDLSNAFDQPLLIDKKSLEDLGLDLKKGATLQANGLSGRTVLRSLLATQGLTFVVKDESIQIVTVDRARNLLTTRVYYLGDIVQGVGPFGDFRFGPLLNMEQTMANVKVLTDAIKKSIDPLVWNDAGGPGSITFHFPSMSIIVRAPAEVHHSLGGAFYGKR